MQTPALQMNVVYVFMDGQSFKVFSCDNTTGACEYQNYKKGQAYQRGEALRGQLAALLPANGAKLVYQKIGFRLRAAIYLTVISLR